MPFAALVFLVSVGTPIVGYAQYQGVVDTDLNITKFLGMCHAAPTETRQAPASPSNISGIQQASSAPPQCYQGAASSNPLDPQTEDCLFLSVYSPNFNCTTESLPTVVWIHGGDYVWGSAIEYNGTELVLESNREVVAIVIQYRLGLFGFLAGQQVKDGGALNAGLLDQDFALRWINKNVHHSSAFSGDPDKVTIWGESAGAGSVLQHIVANNGNTVPQLFRAAITSSTFVPSQYRYNDVIPQVNVLDFFGCTEPNTLDCLRALHSTSLQDINENTILGSFYGTSTFGPVVDGPFIAQSPTDALAQGLVNGDILLSVTNTDEGVIFVNQSADFDVAQYREGEAVESVYQSVGSPLDQVNAIMGESILICPTYRLLAAFPGKSFKGEYAVPPAQHGDDIFYYFPSFSFLDDGISFNNTAFIDAFDGGFLSFVANLNSNAKLPPTITPAWPKWSHAMNEMVFNRTELGEPSIAMAPTSQGLLSRCE
ncbi:Alpha/Beta hydrolase protein [Mycena maculata]|uniref:Alpha/Beta hydrolase protein n=1 Tax=Mycena maculata TaxID=230809 RepID=A0AAD7NZS6_9AGAR|nr:Alpha/Beta hydrolase protein [Mycena maculata]